jgi:hypothetical protein
LSQFKNTDKFLRTYGNQVEQEIETRLTKAGKYASGKLLESVRYEVKDVAKGLAISFYMADYGKFVDKGVEGAESGKAGKGGSSIYKFGNKMPPEKSIKSWLKIKGIPEKASYPIRRSIWKFGITPTNFFTIPTTRRVKQLEAGIKTNMILDAEAIIKRNNKKK